MLSRLVSFVLQNFPVVDVVQALDRQGIAIGGRDLAALPRLKRFGVPAAARASGYAYTQTSEVDALIEAVKKLARAK